jgi:acetyltransferase-like isoleucine patch superfamily enzyme
MADNVEFALRFRSMLADHIFNECGENCRFFKGITFTYGHNVHVGDNTVIHDDVHLDDRGRLDIGSRVSISDGAHLYSHDHDIVDQTEVRNFETRVEDDVRITYDAMVRAGCKVEKNSLVGARAIVQGDVPAHHVVVGTPAKSVRIKPGFEERAESITEKLTNRQDEREISYELPLDLDRFDEFGRTFEPEDKVK